MAILGQKPAAPAGIAPPGGRLPAQLLATGPPLRLHCRSAPPGLRIPTQTHQPARPCPSTRCAPWPPATLPVKAQKGVPSAAWLEFSIRAPAGCGRQEARAGCPGHRPPGRPAPLTTAAGLVTQPTKCPSTVQATPSPPHPRTRPGVHARFGNGGFFATASPAAGRPAG